jgi:hypothetical protein
MLDKETWSTQEPWTSQITPFPSIFPLLAFISLPTSTLHINSLWLHFLPSHFTFGNLVSPSNPQANFIRLILLSSSSSQNRIHRWVTTVSTVTTTSRITQQWAEIFQVFMISSNIYFYSIDPSIHLCFLILIHLSISVL